MPKIHPYGESISFQISFCDKTDMKQNVYTNNLFLVPTNLPKIHLSTDNIFVDILLLNLIHVTHPSVYYHTLFSSFTCGPHNTFKSKEEENCRHPSLWCNDFIYKDFGFEVGVRSGG